MEQQNITAVKGIGEKDGKVISKNRRETVEELLHYYPRALMTSLRNRSRSRI